MEAWGRGRGAKNVILKDKILSLFTIFLLMDELVEEFFKGCGKTLRIMKVLYEAKEPLSKYVIERRAMTYNSRSLLERLVKLGILEVVDYGDKKYQVNMSNSFVVELRDFLVRVGYLK